MYRVMIPETENPHGVSIRRRLRDMLRLIFVDTLGRVHNVCFLARRLISVRYIIYMMTILITLLGPSHLQVNHFEYTLTIQQTLLKPLDFTSV